ncbi:MAG: hypothetical protein J0L73_23545 [Verrucomicrobia bacterium]|nr:hypothetical protein [Verrucomicrobiota bacterium]
MKNHKRFLPLVLLAMGTSASMAQADDAAVTAASTAISGLTTQATAAAGGIILLAVVFVGVKVGKRLLARF